MGQPPVAWRLLVAVDYCAVLGVEACLWTVEALVVVAVGVDTGFTHRRRTGSHQTYANYIRGTQWLSLWLGPATVAFAIPIYEQRALVRRHWLMLLVGALLGSVIAMLSAWYLANLFGFDRSLRLSLMPRSMSTPFAVAVSGEIGGLPDLTAVFVAVTGVCGGALGELILANLPIRSAVARGALFGMGAHGAGTAKAYELGSEEGAVAGLMMVLVGMLNVLAAPILRAVLE